MADPSSRPRILLVTRNLPPLVGGMERLNWHMAAELAKVADVRVVGPAGAADGAPPGVAVCEAPLKPLWKFLLRARFLARREARVWKPDVVLAGSGLTAPLVRSAARACGAKAVAYVHGLDIAVKHPIYRALWLPAIRALDRVIANSRATAELCRAAGVDPARIGIVHPGVDLPQPSSGEQESRHSGAGRQGRNPESVSDASTHAQNTTLEPLSPRERGTGEGTVPRSATSAAFRQHHDSEAPHSVAGMQGGGNEARHSGTGLQGRNPESVSDALPKCSEPASCEPLSLRERGRGEGTVPRSATSAAFRQRHNLGNRPLLLSVGRLSARKGLREFVTQALPQIVAVHPDVVLLIIGDAPSQALHAQTQTPDSIRTAATGAGVGDNVQLLGKVADAELDAAYAAADVHVFPVREVPGDIEGFGMVAVEAAAHGVPTVAFATGGVVDAVADGQSGYLVAAGDYDALADRVLRVLAGDGALGESSRRFAREFAWPRFGEQVAGELTKAGVALVVDTGSAP